MTALAPNTSAPPIADLHEAILYATDLEAAARFYRDGLGLPQITAGSQLMVGFRITPKPGRVLLVFNPEISGVPGRDVPSHGSTGPGHLALRIEPAEEARWMAHLEAQGIAIEQVVDWDDNRGRSIYLRDPAGNSIELITNDIWSA